jgi:hypothetical protein
VSVSYSFRGPWLAILGLVAVAACTKSGGELGPVQRLNAEPGQLARFTFPYYTALAAMPDGSALAVWMRDESPFRPLVYQRAPSAAAPFGEARYLASEKFRKTISVVPSLAAGGAPGELFATWQSREPTSGSKSVVFRRSQDAGGTWQSEVVVNSEPTSFIPSMAADPDGAVYLAWTDERQHRRAAYFNRSLDHGETWLPHDVSVAGDQARGSTVGVSIASDGKGHVVVAWESQGRAGRSIQAAASADRGATWSPPVQVDDEPQGGLRYSPSAPRVVFAGKRAIIVWTTAATNVVARVWSDSSTDGGMTWGTDVLLDETEKGIPSVTDLASDGTTARIVFHAGSLGGSWQIYYAQTGPDGAWETVGEHLVQVSRGEGKFANPRLAVDPAGEVAVAYSDDNRRILLSHSFDGGRTWDAAQPLYEIGADQGKATARFPQAAMANGVAYVMWEVWADPTGMFKSPADAEHKVIPADLFVRRAIFRR